MDRAGAALAGPAGQERRRFVEAVLWLARGGAHWRALPPAWGKLAHDVQTLCPLG